LDLLARYKSENGSKIQFQYPQPHSA